MTNNEEYEIGLTEEELRQLQEVRDNKLPANRSSDIPEGSRQILIVKAHSLIAANYLQSAESRKTFSTTTVLLTGHNSPSSHKELKRAYVSFVEDAASVRQPRYIRARGSIYLWMLHRNLETMLTQIHETNVYCWIGHFGGGHIYADVHTSH